MIFLEPVNYKVRLKIICLLMAVMAIFLGARISQADDPGSGGPNQQQDGQTRKFPEQIFGTIMNMETVRLLNQGSQEVIAKIKTEDDRIARVMLGPESSLTELRLREGSQVSVAGCRATINERAMLMAQQVRSGNKTVSVQRAPDRDLKRFDAEILQTRVTEQRGSAPEYLLARLRLNSGNTTVVNLGPVDNLREIDPRQGKQISMLARPVRIGNKTALVAEYLRIDGKTMEIEWAPVQEQIEKQQQSAAF